MVAKNALNMVEKVNAAAVRLYGTGVRQSLEWWALWIDSAVKSENILLRSWALWSSRWCGAQKAFLKKRGPCQAGGYYKEGSSLGESDETEPDSLMYKHGGYRYWEFKADW